jgi:hypothetical protein
MHCVYGGVRGTIKANISACRAVFGFVRADVQIGAPQSHVPSLQS